MSLKEMESWRKKLIFAKQSYVNRGLIGTSHASAMQTLIRFYRGDMWNSTDWAGLSDVDLMSANKIFPIANSISGDVAARRPEVKLRGRTESAAPLTRPVETLINHDLEDMNWKRQANRALDDHLFAPVGLLQHGFTPQEEFETTVGESKRPRRLQRFRAIRPDKPWARRVPIWNCLMDPSATFFHPDEGMRWVAFRSIELLDDIKANPNMITRDDLKDFAGNIDPEWAPKDRSRLNEMDPEQDQYVEVWTVHESVERTWFQMTLEGVDKPLRERGDWPIPYETLPVSVFSVNEQMDTPFPLSILEQSIPVQEELSKLRTIMHHMAMNIRRIIAVRKNMATSEKDKLQNASLVSMIETEGVPSDAIAQFTVAGFPAELLSYENLLEEEFRELGGQSKMGRGQRINVESAEEASNVQRGQDISIGRVADRFEDFNLDGIQKYMQGRRVTMEITGDEVVAVVGESDAQKITTWTKVTPENMAEDFAMRVEVGSTRRFDRDREAAKRGADLEIAQALPEIFKVAYYARRYVEARGDDPQQAMSPRALLNSFAREVEAMQQRIQPPEEGGTEAPTGGVDANTLNLVAGEGGVGQ